jgi:hypothetical protein
MSNPHSAAKLKTKQPIVSSSNVPVLDLGTATSSLGQNTDSPDLYLSYTQALLINNGVLFHDFFLPQP